MHCIITSFFSLESLICDIFWDKSLCIVFHLVFLVRKTFARYKVFRRCQVKYNSRDQSFWHTHTHRTHRHTHTYARHQWEDRWNGSLGVRQCNFRTHRRNSNARNAVFAYLATFPHFLLLFVFTAYISIWMKV